ncbi:hypothetical protein [Bacteroides sp.]|uniref:hypothetical protein n=1 Tax=Bacteroides sp. TaxID=29523 RepID=UPI001B4C26EA|nr:hypothetical protein [Bacteroides sp.]MBP6064831.1 hypothetical protein [Bacteroides sp.]MBP6067083.1 hypothetical protein [Bacteroides sp.]MBP6935989.1 hypothetical protein [Bacteroides sp.]MBP8621244.1 hypothetical protein [Bacteroides sp.]MBP9506337.1 hypothetical protein [Bacteroides sp.]
MNNKLTYKLSYYALYAMFAVILVVLGIFYTGGEMTSPIVPEMSNPVHTDALLYLMYGLFGIAVVVTVIAFVFQFGTALKDNPAGAIKSLIGIILLVAVLVISWMMGNDEPLLMPGYDGAENVPFWLKLTDMFLYSIYFLLAATVLAIFGSSIKKKLS